MLLFSDDWFSKDSLLYMELDDCQCDARIGLYSV